MRWMFLIICLLIVGFIGLYGAGKALPERVTVIRGVELNQSQEAVWDTLKDVSKLSQWLKEVKSSAPLVDEQVALAPLWEVLTVYQQPLHVALEEEGWPSHLRYKVEHAYLPIEAVWDYHVISDDPEAMLEPEIELKENEKVAVRNMSSEVKLRVDTFVSNAFLRFFMQYVVGYEAVVENYLRQLAQHYHQPDVPIQEFLT